ncbi:MAG: glycerate dehydrogenase, partial [Proteobacteria bacterium]|nr:glycerate dehydrogenase [Pseudomonadota bacterium]
LKKGALVINCARGGLINETALAQALACEHLGGAALDVATTEPPALDHPLMKIKHPNFILTPHIAWASLESRQRLLNETLENIQAFLNGQPRNLVLGSLR